MCLGLGFPSVPDTFECADRSLSMSRLPSRQSSLPKRFRPTIGRWRTASCLRVLKFDFPDETTPGCGSEYFPRRSGARGK